MHARMEDSTKLYIHTQQHTNRTKPFTKSQRPLPVNLPSTRPHPVVALHKPSNGAIARPRNQKLSFIHSTTYLKGRVPSGRGALPEHPCLSYIKPVPPYARKRTWQTKTGPCRSAYIHREKHRPHHQKKDTSTQKPGDGKGEKTRLMMKTCHDWENGMPLNVFRRDVLLD